MLVLSRRENERLVIGSGEIVVTVLEIFPSSYTVRLAIYARGLPLVIDPDEDAPAATKSFVADVLRHGMRRTIPHQLHGEVVCDRRLDQRILIGSDITFTVVAFKGQYVRLGIKAPREIPVHREEVYNDLLKYGHR